MIYQTPQTDMQAKNKYRKEKTLEMRKVRSVKDIMSNHEVHVGLLRLSLVNTFVVENAFSQA